MSIYAINGRCFCVCHDTEQAYNEDGVLVTDALEAAVACPLCQNDHCPALPEPPPPPKPAPEPRVVEPWVDR